MKTMRRLAKPSDPLTAVICPVSLQETIDRANDYANMIPMLYARKYRSWDRSVSFTWNGQIHTINMNFCDDPYCKWYGLPQTTFPNGANRYNIISGGRKHARGIECNKDPIDPHLGATWNCSTKALSNWGLAEEIVRLIRNQQTVEWEPDYAFHHASCIQADTDPRIHNTAFLKKGKSKTNGQRWQCRSCKKITHLLPNHTQSYTYHQQRDDLLMELLPQLLSQTPIKRVCEIFQISASTFYDKLERLYRNCCILMERYDRKLSTMKFDELWLCTDKMIYHLNNIRRRGRGGVYLEEREDRSALTHIVVSADMDSRFIFRADIAYDWNVTPADLEKETELHKDDHLEEMDRRYGYLKDWTYAPQPPTQLDNETEDAYLKERKWFDRRKDYVDGLHVTATYTTMAQLWLIKKTLNVKTWHLISDHDPSINTSYLRIFQNEICEKRGHHYMYKINNRLSVQESRLAYIKQIKELRKYARANGLSNKKLKDVARTILIEQLHADPFVFRMPTSYGPRYKYSKMRIKQPYPSKDKGVHEITCTTDVMTIDYDILADRLMKVNEYALSHFFQQVRRRITTLERPILSARGDIKSYIYANYQPKYAQYLLTILRFVNNFCKIETINGVSMTPAQRLGLTDRVLTYREIVYVR